MTPLFVLLWCLPLQSPAVTAVGDPVANAAVGLEEVERREIARLQSLEGRYAQGLAPSPADLTELVGFAERSESPRTRATAVAVLAWLEPVVVVDPLLRVVHDRDTRVRASAVQALVALARRLSPERSSLVVTTVLPLLDDVDDEPGCAAAELLATLDLARARTAIEERAAQASDVRYACYVRAVGLPLRTVFLPPVSEVATAAPTAESGFPSAVAASTKPAQIAAHWPWIVSAASAGLLAGSTLPAGLLPARDFLLYDDDATRYSRQEVSFLAQAGAGLLGAVIFGGSAFASDRFLSRVTDDEAIGFAGAAGAGAALGAGLGFVLGADGAGQSLSLSLGTLGGVGVGAGAVLGGAMTANDDAMVLAVFGLGTLGATLGTFAAVPVGLETVGAARRTDFALGAGLAGAGALSLAAVAASPFVEVESGRIGVLTAGGFVGGGVVTALGFLLIPRQLNVSSRIACGLGLLGEIAGASLAGWLVPNTWLRSSVALLGAPNANAGRDVGLVFELPTLTVFSPLPGQLEQPVGALVTGHF
jgi:hypothetical protein